MTSVSTTTVTDPSSVNTESAGVEDAESSQGGKPAIRYFWVESIRYWLGA